ncbi:enoyl-CoA hydratase/isomerase family protein [Facklamia miroungae]|uniref:Enoyl-CoA hydratase n=1 Tax=Facklamia miroungae TaxID=120956 RepID=A0A1G7T9W8_9LACT|nr:enoyl-CoA hydratase-related protein [Facklamia miroungae]NKZ29732.1 enoyl-CoA hydratase/isomerase family protein [Facklamia miroungae]SDG32147.1 enoyl-CoA hydratase [Facklamia miroungae]
MIELNTLNYTVDSGIAKLVLNQPKSLNAINSAMLDDLNTFIDAIEADESVRVVILTGEGKAFMAGGDIKEMMKMDQQVAKKFIEYGNYTMNRLANLKQIMIGALNGFALGGGLELALTCDLRIGCAENTIGFPEVGLGIMPGYGGTQRAVRLIGLGATKRLVFTGELIDGKEAYRLGLIDYLAPKEDLLKEADKLAEKLMQQAPLALEKAKLAINRGSQSTLQEGLLLENEIVTGLFNSQDRVEGMSAFVEKRKANFEGK